MVRVELHRLHIQLIPQVSEDEATHKKVNKIGKLIPSCMSIKHGNLLQPIMHAA